MAFSSWCGSTKIGQVSAVEVELDDGSARRASGRAGRDMPATSSRAVDALGQQRLGAGEGQQAAGQRGGAGGALHRVGEVGHDLAARAVEAAPGEVDAADHDRQHVVEVVGDAAGQLADRLHLLDLAQLGLGGLPLDSASAFSASLASDSSCVRSATASSSASARSAFAFGLRAARRHSGAAPGPRPSRGRSRRSRRSRRASSDNRSAGRLGGEDLGSAPSSRAATCRSLSAISASLARSSGPVGDWRRGVIIGRCRPRRAWRPLRGRRASSSSPRWRYKLLQLVDPRALGGIARDQPVELLDLVPGEPPLAVIDVAAGFDLFVEHEAAERGFGAGDAGVDACG